VYITKVELDVAHNKIQTSSGATQSFNRWVSGRRRPRRTLTIHIQLTPRFRMNGATLIITPSSTSAQKDKVVISSAVHKEI
jgi:hypothetical protein